jgi:hypothetical protein
VANSGTGAPASIVLPSDAMRIVSDGCTSDVPHGK